MKLQFFRQFLENTQVSIFMKTRPVGAEFRETPIFSAVFRKLPKYQFS